jgi:hypothetical protein
MRFRVLYAALVGAVICAAVSAQSPAQPKWPALNVLAKSDDGTQPLPKARLSSTELVAIRKATASVLDDLCSQEEEDWRDAVISHLEVKRIHLTQSGPDSLMVRGGGPWGPKGSRCLCGVTGNCQTWIMTNVNGKMRVQMSDMGWGHFALASASKGYFDLVTAWNAGGGKTELTIWRFDGEQYRPLHCGRTTPNDEYRVLQRPCS